MRKIINRCHNAFRKGRFIVDGIICLHEIVHDTKIGKAEGIILKLDFEKAYDKISWDFLFNCLEGRGFYPKWCNWIKMIVKHVTLSVVGPYF